MLRHEMLVDEFERREVDARWRSLQIRGRAPGTARWLRELARAGCSDAGDACDAPRLGLSSRWLVGKPGLPGAIHIEAPPER
mgnify:CR=1 FL=1